MDKPMIKIPDPEWELLRVENRELRHQLNQMYCRSEHILKNYREITLKFIHELHFTIHEAIDDIQERLPRIKKMLEDAEKRDPS